VQLRRQQLDQRLFVQLELRRRRDRHWSDHIAHVCSPAHLHGDCHRDGSGRFELDVEADHLQQEELFVMR
jgi:hypothetical protein